MRISTVGAIRLLVPLFGAAFATTVLWAADHVNPDQATVDALNDAKAIVDAKDALAKAQAALAKDQFPGFGDGFGKTGALTVETADRDKFHVTARSAEAFDSAAKQLAALLNAQSQPVVLLTDADKNSIPVYWSENISLSRLLDDINAVLGKPPEPGIAKDESPAALLGIGSLLSQVAQFTQLFRTDKSLAFTDSLLADEVLLDLVAVKSPEKALYPAAALDSVLVNATKSDFASKLAAITKRRADLLGFKAPPPKQLGSTQKKDAEAAAKALEDKAAATITTLDALTNRLGAVDATTKVPALITVLRGELAQQMLQSANGRALTIRVAAKGGTSLKTSSIWRSDRLYASGGIILSYRLSNTLSFGKIESAGVITVESGFVQIPLK